MKFSSSFQGNKLESQIAFVGHEIEVEDIVEDEEKIPAIEGEVLIDDVFFGDEGYCKFNGKLQKDKEEDG